MDFLVDENLPSSLSEELRNNDFEAKNIRELDRKGVITVLEEGRYRTREIH